MTQQQANALKIVLPFVGVIFGIGVAWRDIKGDVQQSIPEQRFLAESSRTDGTFKAILGSDKETQRLLRDINDRLREICIGVRSGCR